MRTTNRTPRLATLGRLTALRDVKEPTHRSKRVEHGVPGFVAGLHLFTGARGLLLLQCPCENLPKID